MKGYGGPPPLKRRWKGHAVTVLALVFVSLLVPLAFLLGFHNRFPSVYFNDDRSQSEASFGSFGNEDRDRDISEVDGHSRIDNVRSSEEIVVPKTKEAVRSSHLTTDEETINDGIQTTPEHKGTMSEPQNLLPRYEVPPTMQMHVPLPKPLPAPNNGDVVEETTPAKTTRADISTVDEAKKSCQLEFGSYCLWSIEHKEVMKDSILKKLKDQLFVARAYYPSIAKLQGQEQFSRELKENIQEHERMLSEAISDGDLPALVVKKLQKMDHIIGRARSFTVDCGNVDKKLRQILDLTEDEAYFHMKQSAFLYHLGVQTIPKSHHCLSMRLTVEYFKSPTVDTDLDSHKFQSASFRHYVIFSRNILASSVVINSTVMNSKETENMVFHLITDEENYYAMKLWFSRSSYREAAIHVLNFDELYNVNDPYNLGSQLSLSEEFRVSIRNTEQQSSGQTRTEYISVFGHSHFRLPDIFKNLNKVVILDDDVVVQQDLSSLWNLDLEGKVVGAVEYCRVRLGQLKAYLGRNTYEANSCAWMSGLNVIDLENWRQNNITGIYQKLNLKFQTMSEASWRAAALPASLLVFQNQIYPLDSSWALSGLGHNYGVDTSTLKKARVLHYSGSMKPWLELGIPKYKGQWKKYVTRDERFMDECNVNA